MVLVCYVQVCFFVLVWIFSDDEMMMLCGMYSLFVFYSLVLCYVYIWYLVYVWVRRIVFLCWCGFSVTMK